MRSRSYCYYDEYPDSPVTFLPLTEKEKVDTLNRIDQEWQCNHLVMDSHESGPDYCALPEWDPFTNRCWDHTPGNLTSGHM